MKLRAFFCCVAFVALTAAAPKTAQPYLYVDEPLNARLIALPNPANLTIDEIGAVREGHKYFECISFTNKNSKTVTAAAFVFMYFDADKHLVGSDTMNRTGSFATDIQDKGPVREMYQQHAADMPFLMEKFKNCLEFRMPSAGIAFIVVAAQRARYEDGSSWSAPVDQSPSPSATPW